ncbi:glycosyltransferase [bacterium]|nr:glycosyltransferase [bacterium]
MNNVAFLIPALNESDYILKTIKSIRASYPLAQIIVADAGSTDRTQQMCQQENVLVVKGGSPAVGRNNAARFAKAEFFVFLDADTIIPSGFLERILPDFEANRYVAACFPIQPLKDMGQRHLAFQLFNGYSKLVFGLGSLSVISGCCMLVKGEAHGNIGGFDEKLCVLEEIDYFKRMRAAGQVNRYDIHVSTSTRRHKKYSKCLALVAYYILHVCGVRLEGDFLNYWNRNSKP